MLCRNCGCELDLAYRAAECESCRNTPEVSFDRWPAEDQLVEVINLEQESEYATSYGDLIAA